MERDSQTPPTTTGFYPEGLLDPMKDKTIQADTVIVGAGITGLFIASLRAQMGQDVLVVETSTTAGGYWSPSKREGFQLGSGMGVLPWKAWEQLYKKIDLPYNEISISNGNCITYKSKSWQPAENLPPWENHFAQPVGAMPQGGLAGFVQDILSKKNFRIQYEAPLTKITMESNDRIAIQTANNLDIQCKECLWTINPSGFQKIITGDGSEKTPTLFTPAVTLEFAHKKSISEFTETLALAMNSEQKHKQEPCYLMGAFVSNRDQSLAPNNQQISSWIFPLSNDEWGDNHEISKKIRSSRRVLHRSFGEFQDSVLFERVQILKNTLCSHAWQGKTLKKKIFRSDFDFSTTIPLVSKNSVSQWTFPTTAKHTHLDGLADKIQSLPVT